MIRWGPRVTCPVCGRVVRSYTPAKGTGDAWRPWPHRAAAGAPSRMRRGHNRCSGSSWLVEDIHPSSGKPWA